MHCTLPVNRTYLIGLVIHYWNIRCCRVKGISRNTMSTSAGLPWCQCWLPECNLSVQVQVLREKWSLSWVWLSSYVLSTLFNSIVIWYQMHGLNDDLMRAEIFRSCSWDLVACLSKISLSIWKAKMFNILIVVRDFKEVHREECDVRLLQEY